MLASRTLGLIAASLMAWALGCDSAGDAPGRDAGDDGMAVTITTDIPCAAAEVIERRCLRCHRDPPRYGAPMTLVSHAAVHQPAVSDGTREVFELMRFHINNAEDPMPPPSEGPLSSADRATLNAWLDAGAPAGNRYACGDSDGGVSDANVGDGGSEDDVGPEHLPCTPSQTLVAHADRSTAPFHVPASAGNLYQCFAFRSPFADGQQATAWAPVIDDERVVHHLILYGTDTPQPDGRAIPCEMPADAEFLMGWAPGGRNAVLPADVGAQLPGPSSNLILQLHYHNDAGHADADDASGVAICTTDAGSPRANAAGVLWFGQLAINIPAGATDVDVTGTCPSSTTAGLAGPLQLLSSAPHMHELGIRIRADILRGGDPARSETLVEVDPWDFDAQTSYWHAPGTTLMPGDAVVTRCTYSNPTGSTVGFGLRTEDEMCFNFVLAYPLDSLGSMDRRCLP